MLEYLYRKRFGSKIAWADRKEGDIVGVVQSTETGCGGQRHLWWPWAGMWRRWGACLGESPQLFIPTCLWRWNRQSVPKRRHIKFRRWEITQKKAYSILWHFSSFIEIANLQRPDYLGRVDPVRNIRDRKQRTLSGSSPCK